MTTVLPAPPKNLIDYYGVIYGSVRLVQILGDDQLHPYPAPARRL